MKEFKEYSEKHKLSPADQEKILQILKNVYSRSTYEAEEPIGVVAAQSLSEPATQMTMGRYLL